jgi:tetratricopeptide (TPR) repeat protein
MAEKKSKELTKEQIEARQRELAKKIRKAPITEIAHKLKDCSADGGSRCDEARFALFLGAGASFQAGIKTAGQMMSEFREKILKRDCSEINEKSKQEQWLNKNVLSKGKGNEYSKLFEAFERTQRGRQSYISKLIKDKKPTFGYAMLASIIARGFINTILTTNFDDLMFIACNKFTGVRPVIYAYGIMATEMKFSSPHSKILKMHGDYLYSALANTEKEMSLFNQDPNMKAQVAHALNEYELIVFGYSGSDDSVMEILENYPSGKELYWCHWSQELPSLRTLELLHAKEGTLVSIEGFDEAMYEIYKIVDFELDEVLASYEERRKEVLNFINGFDEKYSTPIITDAIEEREIPKVKAKGEPKTWFESYEIANRAAESDDNATAEKYYLRAIKLAPNNETVHNRFGLFLYNQTKFIEAIETLQTAARLNKKYIASRINLAAAYKKQDDKKESEKYASQVIKLIKPDDNYALACINSIRDNKNEAIKFLKLAVEKDSSYKSLAKKSISLEWVRDDERFWEIVGEDAENT